MKFTAEQIKTFVKKTAKGNSTISQITIRNYIMERFLERLSLSEFKNKFILKGGLLIASIVRKDTRDVPFLSTFEVGIPRLREYSGPAKPPVRS